MLHGMDSVTCNDGSLEPDPIQSTKQPRCERIRCTKIHPPKNGYAILTPPGLPFHGSRYEFSCDENYHLFLVKNKTCVHGKWYPTLDAQCLPTLCILRGCRNGGTCIDQGPFSMKCLCTADWTGPTCSDRNPRKATLGSELLKKLQDHSGNRLDQLVKNVKDYLSETYPSFFWSVSGFGGGVNPNVSGKFTIAKTLDRRTLAVSWSYFGQVGLDEFQKKLKANLDMKGCDLRNIEKTIFKTAAQIRPRLTGLINLHIAANGMRYSSMFDGDAGFSFMYVCAVETREVPEKYFFVEFKSILTKDPKYAMVTITMGKEYLR